MGLESLSTVELVLFVSDYVAVVIGLVISYIAYRGYRDHRSKPMLFVAVGFLLLVGVPGVLGVVFVALSADEILIGAVTQVSELVGMCSILYGLWVEP